MGTKFGRNSKPSAMSSKPKVAERISPLATPKKPAIITANTSAITSAKERVEKEEALNNSARGDELDRPDVPAGQRKDVPCDSDSRFQANITKTLHPRDACCFRAHQLTTWPCQIR